jgi:hypothetical protein
MALTTQKALGAATRASSACGTRTTWAWAVEKNPPCSQEVVKPSLQHHWFSPARTAPQ